MGLGNGIFVDLQITHLIDKRRVTEQYLRQMIFGNGYSCGVRAHLHHLPRRSAFKFPRLRDAILMLLRGRIIGSLYLFLDWVCFLRRPAVDRLFLKARARGWEQAVRALAGVRKGFGSEEVRPGDSPDATHSGKDADLTAQRAT
jgi:hypothetical protein